MVISHLHGKGNGREKGVAKKVAHSITLCGASGRRRAELAVRGEERTALSLRPALSLQQFKPHFSSGGGEGVCLTCIVCVKEVQS